MRFLLNSRRTPLATSLLVVIALVSGALAYFTTTGSGNATGGISSLSTPASPAASASGTTATITWNASTIAGSVAATSYTVERYTSAGTDVGAASCSPVSSSSGNPDAFGSFTCSDSPGGGTFKYKITAKYHSSWTATTAFTSTVSVQFATTTSASGPATDATNTAIAASALSSTLAGGSAATGTITFKVFGPQTSAPSTCTSGGTTVGTATVSGNATYHPSAGFSPTSAGTYWWYASYGGDSGNTASASTCGSGMSSTVVKNTTSATASAPASGNVGTAAAASSISSILSGATGGATGTITFTVFGPQASAPVTCTSGGTTVGTAAVSGNATYNPSASFTPSSPGTYWWYASYNGDSNNSASNSTCGSGMTSTSVAKANTSVTAGAPATDATNTAIGTNSISAALSGGSSATGTVTFTVFGPQASAPTTCTSGGTTVGTASVSGNGTYNPNAGFTPSAAGTYWWYVSYNGDSNNTSSNSTCGSGMTSTVVKNATTSTVSGPATDVSGTAISTSSISAALSGGTAGATGTVTFKVFGPQSNAPTDCSGGTTVGTATVSGNATYHPSAGFTPSSAGTYYWYVTYNGDTNNSASTSTCGSGMAATYVYSVSSAASGTTTTASSTSVTTTSFTIQPSTTYLLLVARSSSAGDGISSVSTSGLSPALTLSSFTSVTSQSFTGNNYQWVYRINTSSGASGTGTITINFNNILPSGAASIADLVQLGGVSATNPVVTGNTILTSGTGLSATANLTYAPGANDSSLVFLSGDNKMGAAAPAASPSMTNAYYFQNGAGSAAVYSVTPGAQNESFASINTSQNWGTVALELRRDASVNTPTLTPGAPSTGSAGSAISAGSLSATLSSASTSATNGITFKVFGPQASAPTDCTGGTSVGSAVTVSGNGSYNPSAGFTPAQAGTYWWYADYSGDSSDAHTTSTCGSGMSSTVVSAANTTLTASGPSTGTTSGIAASSISATLSGGSSPTGTITYRVFGPQASAPTDCTTGGTTVGTATVTANGTYNSGTGFTPTQGGTYWWYASYGGDTSNNSSASTCGSAMPETYVYGLSSAASATTTTAGSTSVTTSSFTAQANTTYLLLVSRSSSAGDGISSISSSGLSPSLTQASFTSVASQTYNTTDYQWAYWITTSSGTSGTGTITVNFSKALGSGQISVADLVALGGNNTTNPIVVGNTTLANGNSATAAANLTYAPGSVDSSLVFLSSTKNMPATAPTGTPAMTNQYYFQNGSGSQAVYSATPGTQNESFAISTIQAWGSIALEIRRTGSANTTTMAASAPSTGTAGNTITASSISAALSGAAGGAGNGITFTVFGPQASAPTDCSSGGTTVGTANVSGNGTYTSSANYTPTQAGTYWWYATYSGDQDDLYAASTCGSGMPSTVVATATTTTTVSAPSSGLSGSAISASSISSTLSGGYTPTGAITYTVFGPQASAPTDCTTGGTTVGTSSVTANGAYTSNAAFTPSSTGTYWWYASYGGDSNNAGSHSGCGSGMPATYVYSASSVASVVTTTASSTSATTSSFTLQPSTTYLLLVFRHSAAGDGVTSISSTGLSPSLTTASFTSINSQSFNTSTAYQWAYWITTSSNASGTGSLTVNFNNALGSGQGTILDLVALGGVNGTSPIVTSNEGAANGNSATATANLPSAAASGDADFVFLGSAHNLGSTTIAASPAMSNLFYSAQGAASIGAYVAAPGAQNESFTITSTNWGTFALELTHP
jgi:hypothetical protein